MKKPKVSSATPTVLRVTTFLVKPGKSVSEVEQVVQAVLGGQDKWSHIHVKHTVPEGMTSGGRFELFRVTKHESELLDDGPVLSLEKIPESNKFRLWCMGTKSADWEFECIPDVELPAEQDKNPQTPLQDLSGLAKEKPFEIRGHPLDLENREGDHREVLLQAIKQRVASSLYLDEFDMFISRTKIASAGRYTIMLVMSRLEYDPEKIMETFSISGRYRLTAALNAARARYGYDRQLAVAVDLLVKLAKDAVPALAHVHST